MCAHSVVFDSLRLHGLLCPWNFPGKNTGVCCHFLLRGIFLAQGWNPYLLCLLYWQAVFFFFLIFIYLFILFYFLALQHCIDFAIYQHESAVGIHVFWLGHWGSPNKLHKGKDVCFVYFYFQFSE